MTVPHQIGALTRTVITSDSVATVRAAVSPERRSLRCAARKQGLPAAETGLRSASPSPSPPVSPRIGRMRPDLSAACQALMDAPPVMAEEENEGAVVREYKEQGGAQVRMEHDF